MAEIILRQRRETKKSKLGNPINQFQGENTYRTKKVSSFPVYYIFEQLSLLLFVLAREKNKGVGVRREKESFFLLRREGDKGKEICYFAKG